MYIDLLNDVKADVDNLVSNSLTVNVVGPDVDIKHCILIVLLYPKLADEHPSYGL